MADDPETARRNAAKLVRMALFAESSRTPIKRQDIGQKVFGNERATPSAFQKILDAANEELGNVFGLKLVELTTAKSSSKLFVVKNILPAELRLAAGLHTDDPALMGAVFMTLTLIYVHAGSIKDDELLGFLRRFGIKREGVQLNADDADAGNSLGLGYNAFMRELEKQKYIVRTNVKNAQGVDLQAPDGGGPLMANAWGPRAEVEFPPESLHDALCKLYGMAPGSAERDEFVKTLQSANQI
ncbi:hypothetical protein GGF32_007187 [Allomyces javanicus]|nr:hypothetical protein GGF32_007187 [Allomyces javanicus]